MTLEPLPGHDEPEFLETAERGQVRADEGSVRHIEVFPVDGVGTSIIRRPRPLPGHQRAATRYTLICEEPEWLHRVYAERDLDVIERRKGH